MERSSCLHRMLPRPECVEAMQVSWKPPDWQRIECPLSQLIHLQTLPCFEHPSHKNNCAQHAGLAVHCLAGFYTIHAVFQGGIHLPRLPAGSEYHVLEEHGSGPSQVFAFAPGSRGPPKRIERSFTLVKAGNLDLQQLKTSLKPASTAARPKSQRDVRPSRALRLATSEVH